MKPVVIYWVGAIAISILTAFLTDTFKLTVFDSNYIVLQMMPLVLPFIVVASLFVVMVFFKNRSWERPDRLNFNLSIMSFCVYVLGVLGLLALSSVTYYIGGATYEYSAREWPAWTYHLWGTTPIILLASFLTWISLKLGFRQPKNNGGPSV